jgi:DNA (cytosine-5)-methyltransferase 1
MQVHPTTDLESSLSPIQVLGTPTTATSGRSPEFRKGSNPNPVEFVQDLLRTPVAIEGEVGAVSANKKSALGRVVMLRDEMIDLAVDNGLPVSTASTASLLPTVTVQDGKNTAGKSQFERNTLPLNAQVTLLGTPRVSAANSSTPKQVEAGATKSRIEDQVLVTNWGKFAPAIERWESLTRPAPAPTKPDGKDGNHRLSAEFTEWMMGLPEGWVTAEDIGLKRNDQLKACGNGVVPQQAELALRFLLGDTIKVESALEKN